MSKLSFPIKETFKTAANPNPNPKNTPTRLPGDLVRKIVSSVRDIEVRRYDVEIDLSKNAFLFTLNFVPMFPVRFKPHDGSDGLEQAVNAQFGDRWSYIVVDEGFPARGNHYLSIGLAGPNDADPVMEPMPVMNEIWATIKPFILSAMRQQTTQHFMGPRDELMLDTENVTGGPEYYNTQIVQTRPDPDYGRKVVLLSKADPVKPDAPLERVDSEEYFASEE